MIRLRNSKNFEDVIEISLNESGAIDVLGGDIESGPISGFFDTITSIWLCVFSLEGQLYIGDQNSFHKIETVATTYALDGDNRQFSMVFPNGRRFQINYHLKDLIADKALLIGSFEEVEDYDFGCFLHALCQSKERQIIAIKSWS